MIHFDEILAIAVERKDSIEAVVAQILNPLSVKEVSVVLDDRWLSQMMQNAFRAAFLAI